MTRSIDSVFESVRVWACTYREIAQWEQFSVCNLGPLNELSCD